ncbi:hypothetical protein Drorol1_Dr00014446 [Drosera rotundifolia]
MDSVKIGIAKRGNLTEEIGIISGLIGVEILHGVIMVLLSYIMGLGLDQFSLIVFSTFFSFLFLLPISLIFERELWPKKLTIKFMVQLVLIAFTGTTLFQSLLLRGLKMTSPALSAAMPNLTPAFIFIIAWVFRLEKVNLSCLYSKLKILGTLLCVVGAAAMSIMISTTTQSADPVASSSPSPPTNIFDLKKIIGCLYLITAVIALSSSLALQAYTLGDFHAPITLSALQSLAGSILTALAELCQEQKFDVGWPAVTIVSLIGFTLLIGTLNGMAVSFTTWAMKKRGPVLVSMFGPIATVASALLAVIFLGDTIKIGSLPGMFVMFGGLYLVLWAKRKEGYTCNISKEIVIDDSDAEKPLLAD